VSVALARYEPESPLAVTPRDGTTPLLRARFVTALVLIPMAGWVVWAGGWWFFGALLLVAELGGYEFSQLIRRGGYTPQTVFTLAIIAMLLLDAQFPSLNILRPALVWLLMVSVSWQLFQSRDKMGLTNWALTVIGGLYVGILAAQGILIRALPQGLAWTVLAVLLAWAGDTAAYFVGTTLGRHKLWPRISPSKTWEGFFGGLIACVVTGTLVGYLAMRWVGAIGPVHGTIVGLLAGAIGVFGDLAISMMKRQMNVKDSGNILPGHGGLLDRTDSLLFVIATTYYYAIWLAT
jgi:phosphatidate cytidylyltransferase